MLLSKLLLINAHSQVRSDLGSPYSMHRTIMRSFPTPLPEGERVLFRVEYPSATQDAVVLVQSITAPDWGQVLKKHDGYFLRDPEIRPLEGLNIMKGDLLRFRMRVAISKRVLYKNTGKSQRVSLFSEHDRIDWLVRKATNGGFSVLPDRLIVRDAPYRNFLIKKGLENQRATLNMVDVDGLLLVEDVQKLFQTMKNGIGPAKGFGCGLISVARA